MEARLPGAKTALRRLPRLRARATVRILRGALVDGKTILSRRQLGIRHKPSSSAAAIPPSTLHRGSKRLISKHVFNSPTIPSHVGAAPRTFREFGTSGLTQKPSQDLEAVPEIDDPPAHVPSTQNNSKAGPKITIRDRLRIWEAEHTKLKTSYANSRHWMERVGLHNFAEHPEGSDYFWASDEQDETYAPIFTRDDLIDFGDNRKSLRRGDLVELRSASRTELAIFVRNLESQSQFYSMSGKWMHQRTGFVKFSLPNFVNPEELDSLLPYLPDADVAQNQQNKLMAFENALPRTVGAPLVTKMVEFWRESDLAYRSDAARIDGAHRLVARPDTMRYATLDEITREVLPKLKHTGDGRIPRPVLYAVHRSLMQDSLGFRTTPFGNHRGWQQYEISSMDQYNAIIGVCAEVRRYQDYLVTTSRVVSSADTEVIPRNIESFLAFIAKAQRLIDRSRKRRQLTPDGIIGPAQMDSSEGGPPFSHLKQAFDSKDTIYLRFMESWAALRTFDRQSGMHAIGSAILRATGRYDSMPVDESAAWTFLQEIGAITPWENRAAFDLRLRNTARGLQSEVQGSRPSLIPQDSMANIRKDWGNLPIYCIDDKKAHEIDDGVSVEPTNVPGEYWIHVHVADPTSQIDPGSMVAKRAEHLSLSVYFPERFTALIPTSIVQSQFSLAPHRPCLTVSIKMNSGGQILEQQITTGKTGNNVVYLTPRTLDEVIGCKPCEGRVIAVGPDIEAPTERIARNIQGSESLSDTDKENLRSLCQLAKAYHDQASQRGRVILQHVEKTISVDFVQEKTWHKEKEETSFCFHTDPRIEMRLTQPHDDFSLHIEPSAQLAITSLMILACETAAKWCADRGIPIVFRASEKNLDMPDPLEFFHWNFLPFVGKQPPEGIVDKYMNLAGYVLPTTSPGPHVLLGVDMYTKFTSPLRRYGDLVGHWQVNAALREEARTGKSLIGSTRTDYLPFSKEDLDKMVPRLHIRESAVLKSGHRSTQSWTLQLLLRAWKFKEAPLPPTWEYTVTTVQDGNTRGVILALATGGVLMPIPKSMRAEEIRKGDVFEVEFEALNPYTARFQVKGLSKLRSAKIENEL